MTPAACRVEGGRDAGPVAASGKRRRRLAARTAPEVGRWEVVAETRDPAEMRRQARRLREAGVDSSLIRIDTLCGRLRLPTIYRLSRFVAAGHDAGADG